MIKDLILEVFKFIGELNYWHVGLLTALESTAFPVVIPVETVIIPMGYYAYLGTKNLPLLMFSCTIGIVVGCWINYWFARALGRTFIYKHSHLLHINIEKLQKLERKFLSHGRLLMFVGRFIPIPAFKHIITIPAGMAKMPLFQFTFYNALGGFIFSTSMLLIGYFFGGSEKLVSKAITNFTIVCVVALCVYIIVKLVISFISKRQKQDNKGFDDFIFTDTSFNNESLFGIAMPRTANTLKLVKSKFSNKKGIKKTHFIRKKYFKSRFKDKVGFFKKRKQHKFFRAK